MSCTHIQTACGFCCTCAAWNARCRWLRWALSTSVWTRCCPVWTCYHCTAHCCRQLTTSSTGNGEQYCNASMLGSDMPAFWLPVLSCPKHQSYIFDTGRGVLQNLSCPACACNVSHQYTAFYQVRPLHGEVKPSYSLKCACNAPAMQHWHAQAWLHSHQRVPWWFAGVRGSL